MEGEEGKRNCAIPREHRARIGMDLGIVPFPGEARAGIRMDLGILFIPCCLEQPRIPGRVLDVQWIPSVPGNGKGGKDSSRNSQPWLGSCRMGQELEKRGKGEGKSYSRQILIQS